MLPIFALVILQVMAVPPRDDVAPDTTRRATQYKLERWTDTDGLPQNSIRSVAQTTDGFVWLASEEGLIRFDGVRFSVYNPANTPALKQSQILSLAAGGDGTLWIGTANGGLVRYHDGKFQSFATNRELPSERIQAIAVDETGTVWAGTNAGLARINASGEVTVLNSRNGLPADEVTSVVTGADGVVWAGTNAGLVRVTSRGVSVYGAEHGLPLADIRSLSRARDGGIWIGTNGGGVVQYDGVKFRTLDTQLSKAIVLAITEENNGALWIGTNGSGLHRWLNGRLETLNNRSGAADVIWSLEIDREGSLWAGTNGRGLLHLRKAMFVPFGPPEGLSGEIALAVLQTRNGDRWIGTAGAGLNRITPNGTITHFGAANGLHGPVILSLAEMPNGDMLVGSLNGFLARYRGGRFTEIGKPYGLRTSVMAILPDTAGGFWLGLAGGGVLHVNRDGRQHAIREEEGLAENFVMALHRSSDGAVWAGTRRGISRIVNGQVTDLAAARQLAGIAVAGFHQRADGSVWVSTQGRGIARIAGDSAKFLDKNQGLCEDIIHAIVDDGAGYVWMSSNKGIARLDASELDAYFAGQRTRVNCTLHDTGAGMRSREANGGFMPASARLHDGTIVFPTMQGFVTVNPRQLGAAPAAARVVLQNAVLGEDTVALGTGMPLRIATTDRNLEIHFTSPYFRAPDRLRFRFRLDGFDKAWQDAGGRRAAYYTNLPPGEYVFHVMVANEDGVWRIADTALPVIVPAHFYETWWFLTLCGAILCITVLSIHRYRLNAAARTAARLSALVEERSRAEERYRDLFENASDMVFTSGLTGVILSWNAEAERLTGYLKEEAVGSPINGILPQISEISNLSRRDITFTKRNGEPAAIEIATRVISENGQPIGFQVIGRDVYEWRRMELHLQQAAKMEAIGQLAGGVAHDFNNLLTIITSYSDIVRSDLPEESALRSDVDQIRAAADNAATLTRQLLAFSRRQVLQPRVVDMNRNVGNVVGMLRRVIGVDITLETDLATNLWPVHADAVQLEQVLMNLALNARDAMPKGGTLRLCTRNLEIDKAAAEKLRFATGRYVELVVEDTGVGIDAADLPHLFEPFFTTKEVGLGTGLGLATVYGVVKQSGGHIVVDSRAGAGTRFHVYLPVAVAGNMEPDSQQSRQPGIQNVPQHVNILLVEDEPSVSQLAHRILARNGFNVRTAASGREALRVLNETGEVDLLLTDIMMPGMNGRELAHAVLDAYPGTSILYMSGYTEDEVIRRGELPEGEKFIGKPFTPSGLVNAVLAALVAGRPGSAARSA